MSPEHNGGRAFSEAKLSLSKRPDIYHLPPAGLASSIGRKAVRISFLCDFTWVELSHMVVRSGQADQRGVDQLGARTCIATRLRGGGTSPSARRSRLRL